MSDLNGHHPPRRRAPIRDPELALLALAATLEGADARKSVERLLPTEDTEFLWATLEAAITLCPSLTSTATADQLHSALTQLTHPLGAPQ